MKKKYYIFVIKDSYDNNRTSYQLVGPFSYHPDYSYSFNVNGYETREEAEKALADNQPYAPHFVVERYEW